MSLYEVATVFAVVNGLLAAALGAAETDNDWLKSALSTVGVILTILWLLSVHPAPDAGETARQRAVFIHGLPGVFGVGWLVSACVHVSRLRARTSKGRAAR